MSASKGKIRGITIELNADTSKLYSALQGTNSTLGTTKKTLSDVERLLKLDPKNTELLQQKSEKLNTAIGQTEDKLKKQKELLQELEKQAKNGTANQEQQQALRREIIETESKLKDLQKTAGELPPSFADVATKIGASLENVGGKITSVGDALTNSITTKLVNMGVSAVTSASTFTDAMAKVSTIMDEGELSVEDMEAQILELSDSSGIAAEDIADNVYNAISAGQKTADAVNFVSNATKLAKAGFTDSASALDILTSTMNAYGMSAEEVTSLSDKLLVTQNLGKTTVGDLASTLGGVIPTAHAAGLSIDEVLSTMVALTKNGVATNQAATGLRAALSNIVKPTTSASDAAAALGIKFDAAELSAKGLGGFLDEIKDALANASPEYGRVQDQIAKTAQRMRELEDAGKTSDKEYKELKLSYASLAGQLEVLGNASDSPIAAFAELFGSVKALNSVMVLTSDTGSADYANALAAMGENAGLTDEAFNKMLTPSAKLKKALNNIQNAAIDVGSELIEMLAPKVEKVIGVVKDAIKWWNGLSSEEKKQKLAMLGIVAAVGPVTNGIGKMITIAGKLNSALGPPAGLVSIAGMAAVAIGTGLYLAIQKAKEEEQRWIQENYGATEGMKALSEKVTQAKEEYESFATSLTEKGAALLQGQTDVEKLKDTYNLLVDETGKIKEGNEFWADNILNELASALGIERDQVDKLIEANGKLGESIDEVIQKQYQESAMAAMKSDYDTAVEKSAEAQQNYVDALANREEAETRLADAADKYQTAMEKYNLEMLSGKGVTAETIAEVNLMEEALKEASNNMDKQNATVTDCMNTYLKYQNVIQNFSEAQKAIMTGDAEAINEAIFVMLEGLQTAEFSTKEALQNQLKHAEDTLEQTKKSFELGVAGFTQTSVDNAQHMYELAEQEMVKYLALYGDSGKNAALEYNTNFGKAFSNGGADALKEYAENIAGAKTGLNDEVMGVSKDLVNNLKNDCREQGGYTMLTLTKGIKKYAGVTMLEASRIARELKDNMLITDSDEEGRFFIYGIDSGMEDAVPRLLATAKSISRRLRETFDSDLDINSPSKWAMGRGKYIGEGLALGIKASTKDALKASLGMSEAVQGALQSAPASMTANRVGGAGSSSATTRGDVTINMTVNGTAQMNESVLADKVINRLNYELTRGRVIYAQTS